MAAEPPVRWKIRIRRFLVVLLFSPFLLLAACNAFLASPWGRGMVSRKLSARTGFDTSVDRVTLTPWGGLCLGNLTCFQPSSLRGLEDKPLCEVREIRVLPDWYRLVRGDLAISMVKLDRPRVVLMLVGSPAPPESADVPAPSPAASSGETSPEVSVPPSARDALSPSPEPPVEEVPTAGKADGIPASGGSGTTWVEVTGGEAEVWLGGTPAIIVRGGDGVIPAGGAQAFSSFRVSEVGFFGKPLVQDLVIPLKWKAPELRCDEANLGLPETEVRYSAVLGVMSGLPFAAAAWFPRQAADGSQWLPEQAPVAGEFEAAARIRGLLRHPAGWQGEATVSARTVAMEVAGLPLEFDEARCSVTLQEGVIECPDVRLIGDQASFLGNGRVGMDGQRSAVLRAVLPPWLAEIWTSRLSVGDMGPVFSPLGAPDRQFIDLRWIPYDGGNGVELGSGGPVVAAGDLFRIMEGE